LPMLASNWSSWSLPPEQLGLQAWATMLITFSYPLLQSPFNLSCTFKWVSLRPFHICLPEFWSKIQSFKYLFLIWFSHNLVFNSPKSSKFLTPTHSTPIPLVRWDHLALILWNFFAATVFSSLYKIKYILSWWKSTI
jgi:hypothetical protein